MIKATKLSFSILNEDSCKQLPLMDTSFYSSNQTIANPTLQIITPFDDEPVEVSYYKNAVTVLNSNNLKITNVVDSDYLVDLPDGLYTAKISICPEDQYWYEKSWYRTCQLECKYDRAFLKLNINPCDACFSPDKIQRLERARMYIHGCKVNTLNCNQIEAKKLYSAALKIVDNLLLCDCNEHNNRY